jgi:hypothetical protein
MERSLHSQRANARCPGAVPGWPRIGSGFARSLSPSNMQGMSGWERGSRVSAQGNRCPKRLAWGYGTGIAVMQHPLALYMRRGSRSN